MPDHTQAHALEQYVVDHLDEAIEKRYIRPYFQPVVRAVSRQLCGMEALARWDDPVWGLLPPASFIDTLEKHRLIHKLDISIVRQVCELYREAVTGKGVILPISINLSRMDYEMCDIFAVVEDAVESNRMPRNLLCIEITESALNENGALMRQYIDRFRAAGYQVWMDDFGSGYSSLNVLKDYDFDELKVDMWFLSDLHEKSKKILSSIVHMAKEIEIQTLVEGVETEEQFLFLRNIGVEKVQGYLFGKPQPYLDCIRHVLEQGIQVEQPVYRKYYDDLGHLDVLSATPFLSPSDRKVLATGREQNSIPLALIEMREENVRLLFTNEAFDEASSAIDWISIFGMIETDPHVKEALQLTAMSTHLKRLLEEARSAGNGKMYFVDGGEYFELEAKRVSLHGNLCSVVLCLTNLSRGAELSRQESLDDSLRAVYSIYDQVSLLDLGKGTLTQLYVDAREIEAPMEEDLNSIQRRYANEWIYVDDRQRFFLFTDPATLPARIARSGKHFVSVHLRTRLYHGSYIWKVYILLHIQAQTYAMLVRDAESDMRDFQSVSGDLEGDENGTFSAASLWRNLSRSNTLKLFWKDKERRFRGVSQSFLDFYGFLSPDEVLGKTDEDMGWHLHPDSYQHDEWEVIREGVTTHNVPGYCIVRGENRKIIASKMPLYDGTGQIAGLLGYFAQVEDREEDKENGQVRLDALTGLLNARGLTEELFAYRDEYELRKVDFARIHVNIEDFAEINQQYGYDFGDSVIRAVAEALLRCVGKTASVSRTTGGLFVALAQFHHREELDALVERIRRIPATLRQVDGIPYSLFLSVGASLFSETLDTAEQASQARLRMLLNQGRSASVHQLRDNMQTIFHVFDSLPIPYAVYQAHPGGPEGVEDATILYVNRAFKRMIYWRREELTGKVVSELFPMASPEWLDVIYQSAFLGKEYQGELDYPLMRTRAFITAAQVIGKGFCALTYQTVGGPQDAPAPDGNRSPDSGSSPLSPDGNRSPDGSRSPDSGSPPPSPDGNRSPDSGGSPPAPNGNRSPDSGGSPPAPNGNRSPDSGGNGETGTRE